MLDPLTWAAMYAAGKVFYILLFTTIIRDILFPTSSGNTSKDNNINH
jgi:hypothetical protein